VLQCWLEARQHEGSSASTQADSVAVGVAQCTQSAPAVCCFAVLGWQMVLTFAFPFPRLPSFPQGSCGSCQHPPNFSLCVLLLVMIKWCNHPGPNQMEGPTPSSNTSGHNCQEGSCYHSVTSTESLSLPLKVPQRLEGRIERGWCESGTSVPEGVGWSFSFCLHLLIYQLKK
jgi:hypothetical protein